MSATKYPVMTGMITAAKYPMITVPKYTCQRPELNLPTLCTSIQTRPPVSVPIGFTQRSYGKTWENQPACPFCLLSSTWLQNWVLLWERCDEDEVMGDGSVTETVRHLTAAPWDASLATNSWCIINSWYAYFILFSWDTHIWPYPLLARLEK